MVVFWWRLCGVSHSIIRRILDNGKKKEYKAYFEEIRVTSDVLKKYSLDIQEHEEGLWIEIHMNETNEDKDDLSESEDGDQADQPPAQ